MRLDLDAISFGDMEVSNSGAPRVSPVLIVDQEIAAFSVHSSVSVHVVESPAQAEPVVLSAVSSVLISPNRVWEDCYSVSLDVYPVYEVSPW